MLNDEIPEQANMFAKLKMNKKEVQRVCFLFACEVLRGPFLTSPLALRGEFHP
jgi:hypothetical protein